MTDDFDRERAALRRLFFISVFPNRVMNCPGFVDYHYMTKRYRIRSTQNRTETLEIISEGAEGFQVRIIRRDEYGETDTTEDFMTHDLFEMCLRTAYLREIAAAPEEKSSVA